MTQSLLRAAFVALFLWGCGAPTKTFVIYHTSDIHGGISAREARWHKANPKRRVGGFAALSALLKKEKLPYLLLDSGDIFQGTPEGNLTKGEAVISAMNALAYDAVTIGNHEYDYGEDNLVRLEKMAQFPMLASNIFSLRTKQLVPYATPTKMVTVAGVKVGLIGLATRDTARSTLPANVAHLTFGDEAEAARKHADALIKDGAEVVIAMAHCGLAPSLARVRIRPENVRLTASDKRYEGDLYIARGAPVDLVLGGHMHVGLEGPWRDPVSGVHIVQSYDNLLAVSRVVVTVSEDKVDVSGELIDLWVDKTGEDPAIRAILKPYEDEVGRALNKVVGHAAKDFIREGHPLDNPLGNWMADAMRAHARADIGIQNTYGIRDDLRAGPITLRHLYQVMPFENTLVVAKLSGRSVLKMAQSALRGGKSGLQISGMSIRFRWDPKRQVAKDVEVTVNGKRVTADGTYTVATNNYLVSGGSGAGPLAGAPAIDTHKHLRNVIIDYVKAHSPISPPSVGRFQEIH